MQAFVFHPSNRLAGKFKIGSIDELADGLSDYCSSGEIGSHYYVEAAGNCWTIIGEPPNITLAEGRISPPTSVPAPRELLPHASTNLLPGFTLLRSHGMVFGEAILGANLFRDLFAGVADIIGGRSGMYESKLNEGRSIALLEMSNQARKLGATGVVGVSMTYEALGANNSMFMICATGTAVTAKQKEIEQGGDGDAEEAV